MKPTTFAVSILGPVLAGAAGVAGAAQVHYDVDPLHTFPSLEFPHMGISIWRGKFDRTRGTVTLDRAARTGAVDIVIDAASINFGLAEMDEHARSADWLAVEAHPEAKYSGALVFGSDLPVAVDGEITFRGMTRPLRLTINSFACIEHPLYKKEVCGADASGEMNWSEWGMTHSEYGKGAAGKVTLRIQVEAMKRD